MTHKTALAALAAFLATSAGADETMLFSTGASAPFAGDSRPAPRIAAATETLAYSTAWGGGATATVKVGDKTLATKSGEGTVVWNAADETPGLVTLTHASGGETLTADFAVLGEETIAIDCDRLPSSATWASNRVYVITQALTVPSGVALTIQPGAVVKFVAGASLTVASGGSCVAKGAIFTHVADDTAGGDTLFDGDATRPVTGAYEVSGSVTDDDDTEYRYTAPVVTSGTISSNTNWRGHKVYKVTGNLTVASGATLTIQPGAIVKFASGVSLTVNSGATLDAQGTRAAPIVFTSVKDDAWGGDTNGDGDETTAQAGDWHQIYNQGTITMDHCQVLWCSAQNNQGALYPYGGTWLFKNSIVAHCQYDNMRSYGGSFTAENSLFLDGSMGAAPSSGTAKFINCVFNNLTTAVRWGCGSFYNCVFSDIATDIIDTKFYSSTLACTFDHCVFWNPESSGDHASAKVGKSGCVYADPLFTDAANWDFTISANSPCVDAGDGTVAPETDYYGRPRMDVKRIKDTGVANADGVCPDIGIYEVEGTAAVAAPDLAVVSLTAPASVRAGEEITVTYVVTNRAAVLSGTARDSFVFTAEDASLGGQRVAAGEVSQTYDIPSNGCASVSATLTVPSLKAGVWRLAVTVNAERDIYEKITANNMGRAAGTTTVSLPVIADGTTRVTLAEGANAFAVTDLPIAGGTVILTLPAGAAAYGANGYVPGAERSDAVAVDLGDGRVALVFPSRDAGTAAYLTVESVEAGEVSVEVAETALALYGASPSRLANTGTVRLTLTGTGLDGAEVSLVGAATFKAAAVEAVDVAHAVATFALDKAAVGTYAVRVTAGGKTATLANAAELYTATTGPKLEANLVLPSSVRDGRIYTAWIEYANTGDEDMPAPLFTVKRTDSASKLKALLADDFSTEPLHFVGIGSAYPAGVLAAGDSGRIPFYFMPSGAYALTLSHAKDETATTSYAQFSSTADYRQAVDEAATRLNARGTAEHRVRACVNFALAERAGRAVAAISGTAVDAVTREPLAGVSVTATLTNDTTRTASATADADGRFTLAMLADGDWRLTVDGAVTDGTNIVTIAGQGDANGRTLAARELAKVTGTVLTADTHEPLAGAAVRLYREGGELAAAETQTDDAGAFALEGTASGTYALVVNSADGYVGAVVTNVTLSLGGNYAAGVFELERGAVLYGTVTAGGRPVTNGTVYAMYEDGSAARATCSTNGAYCFNGLPPYAYQVRYAGESAGTDYVDATVAVGESRRLDLTATETPLFFAVRPRGYGTLTTSFMVADPVLATNATAFAWDFDNDGTVDSREAEPSHTYAATGTYSVKLVATTPQGQRTSLYENCVTVEEAIENVLNANAFRVDETDGIDCTAMGETTLTLRGTPPMTLEAGVVVGGQFNGEWYIRKIKTVSQSGTTYTLTTEDATLDDLYASYCFTSCQEVTLSDEPSMMQSANSFASKLQLHLMARSKKPQESVKVVGGIGYKFTGSCSPRIYLLCENTRKNGQSYSCVGLAGEVALDLSVEAFGELGGQYNVPVPLSIDIPTPVPFVDVAPKLEFGINIGASGKASGSIGVSACPRIKVALEKVNDGRWHFANPWDGFNFDYSCYQVEFGGNAGFELYAKAGGTVKAFKVMNVGIEKKFSVGAQLSGGTKSASKFEVKYASTITAEANAFDSSKIPLVGKWLDFKVGVSAEWETGSLVLASITSPEPDFVMSPDHGNSPLAVNFLDNAKSGEVSVNLYSLGIFSVGATVTHQPPTAWEWDLYFTKSTAQSPTYTYYADGEYEISQRVRGVYLHPGYAKVKKLYVGKEKPPEDDQQNDDKGGGTPAKSCDPNEMAGPEGVGANRLVKPGEWMDYTIYFENKTNATAAAQEVFVDAQLDANLDWSTFETGEIAFNNQNETGLAGYQNGTKTVAQTGADYKVQMSVAFDEKTGKVQWYLRSYDPNRADYGYWPASTEAGFLPPNDETHRGEGHITYRIKVRENATAGSRIDAAASIVFDQNEAIATDPAWWNAVGEFPTLALSLGEAGMTNLTLVVGEPFGELPTPTRTGYTFAGWFLGPDGTEGRISAATLVPSGLEAIYPAWTANAIGLVVDGVCRTQHYDDVVTLEPPAERTVGRTNWVCTGWVGSGSVPKHGTGCSVSFTLRETSSLDWLFATNFWTTAETVTSEGGRVALTDSSGASALNCWTGHGSCLTATATAFDGWRFVRWTDEESGEDVGRAPTLAVTVERPVALRALFERLTYAVAFDLREHGTRIGGGELLQTIAWGESAVAPTVEPESGYAFVGWSTSFDRVTGNLTVAAIWEETHRTILEGDVTPVCAEDLTAALTYDGYLVGADGAFAGTVQVKAAKAKTDKTGKTTSKLSVTLQLADGSKKVSISGAYDTAANEAQTLSAKGRAVTLLLGTDGLTGSFEGLEIVGVRSVFVAKDAASKTRAAAAELAYVRTYNIVADEGVFAVSVAKKGKVKVSGTTAGGKKLNVTTQLLVGKDVACVPVVASKLGLKFMVWIGSTEAVEGLANAHIGPAGTLRAGAQFAVDADALARIIGDATYKSYLPSSVAVEQSGSKWVVAHGAKAGKVTLKKDKSGVDETKLGENPSALKLTYSAKNGSFKGSFKAYVQVKGKPKALSATVTGVLINGVGYGTATIKKYSSVDVRIQ